MVQCSIQYTDYQGHFTRDFHLVARNVPLKQIDLVWWENIPGNVSPVKVFHYRLLMKINLEEIDDI